VSGGGLRGSSRRSRHHGSPSPLTSRELDGQLVADHNDELDDAEEEQTQQRQAQGKLDRRLASVRSCW
jgi:hypothetical protein